MAELTQERMGEIALAMVKKEIQKNGLPLAPDARRRLSATAKEIGVSVEEMETFVFALLPELIGAAYGYGKVGLTRSERKQSKDEDK